MTRVKLFLGGVINAPNAQNNNCKSLANSLDNELFDITVLQTKRLPIESQMDCKTIIIRRPIKLFKYIAFARGIINSDVSYLPKTECMTWNRFICRIFRKRYFRTIESIIDERIKREKGYIIDDYKKTDILYSITPYMKDYNYYHHNILTQEKILYLGVDEDEVFVKRKLKKSSHVKNVVMIGHDLVRKGIYDYIKLSECNSEVEFHIVGSGNGKVNVEKLVSESDGNIKYHGSMSQSAVTKLLIDNKIDLMVLPSHIEGFPKVILECAKLKIPSLVYSTYGAGDWMDDGVTGFVVDDFKSLESKFRYIKENYDHYLEVSKRSYELYERFTWSKRVIDWQHEILKVAAL
ncbi:glycosyltransferase family 4 protein [Vibrio cholerae]|uniref:glycosyltransferase family 4 protein n=1 Tax=Vibrio cholerae TaxID=666 RepID=UPI00215D3304|nr:glycosyltransferase family 4 protein [Vibrio cholerae]MCR9872835.1 glycosyltransferase family 4 protein [Vibrio cholerae]